MLVARLGQHYAPGGEGGEKVKSLLGKTESRWLQLIGDKEGKISDSKEVTALLFG